MRVSVVVSLGLLVMLVGCLSKPLPPVTVTIPTRTIDYQTEVKPILDKRCVVCHSCYNSPCQLKLSSFEGADRGATKKAIYDSSRLLSMDPSRLFTDAQSTSEWREKGFVSVTGSTVSGDQNDSLMLQMLSHKMKNPKSTGEYRSEEKDLTCSENQAELGSYLRKHPNRGMPFGFPPLKQEEYELIAGWLVQGAKGPDAAEQKKLETPQGKDVAAIQKWEGFLNREDAKHAMTARYLYEHLFLAHLRFGTKTNEFYEMVRSRTAPGQPIDIIPTVRPYDDPEVERVYYRFRKIYSTIVHKTHMVVEFDEAMLQRVQELFIETEWLQTPHLVGYDPELSANPFLAYEQIPPRSRYQYLLDNSLYMIMTFIHGPVCKGQIALNVIDDHFWIMFLDPDHELSVKYPGFLKAHSKKLRMPIERGSDLFLFSALKDEHRQAAVDYYRARQDFYTIHNYAGLDYESIWRGERAEDAPVMTVYRHFDSASVHKGALGNLPKSAWVIDYPLLERIYYALVAGFDIYGNAGHQLAIRLYMDRLRIEGESSFLNFLPPETREPLMQSWYLDVDIEGEDADLKDVSYYASTLPGKITFQTDDPKREFIEHVVDQHLLPEAGITFDEINYLRAGEDYPPLPEKYESEADYLRALRVLSRPGMPFVALVNDHNANLAYLRVRLQDGSDVAGTMVVNRWHDNVAFLLREDARLNPAKDSVDFIPRLIGSYPNQFFDVREEDLPDFLDLLEHYQRTPEERERLAKYAINRADDRFWEVYDWFQAKALSEDPVRGGLFDLNRYHYVAR